ncbi:MAG: hypothetical protein KAT07_01090 [Calditrichia bacterium]|nr:hypothetical protein [Calditrichia bacterium]
MSRLTKNACQLIQNLLLKKETDILSDSEQSQLVSHLEKCEVCRNYQEKINQLHANMKIDESSVLEPRENTRQYLLSRIEQMNKRPRIWYHDFLEKIKSLLGYRIPVYQAMLAFAVIALFILVLSQAYLIQTVPEKQNFFSSGYDSVDINMPDLRVHLNFIDEDKMGRNLKEDSILARYIIKSL